MYLWPVVPLSARIWPFFRITPVIMVPAGPTGCRVPWSGERTGWKMSWGVHNALVPLHSPIRIPA